MPLEPGGQRLGDGVVVFDQQHPHGSRMTPVGTACRELDKSWPSPYQALAVGFPAASYGGSTTL
jgi:hypothetical protein